MARASQSGTRDGVLANLPLKPTPNGGAFTDQPQEAVPLKTAVDCRNQTRAKTPFTARTLDPHNNLHLGHLEAYAHTVNRKESTR